MKSLKQKLWACVTEPLPSAFKTGVWLLSITVPVSFAVTLGLSYGAGIIVDHVDRGHLSLAHANILNYHIAVSHSLLEDTALFVAIGVSVWWITLPRVILAGIVVWTKRLSEQTFFRKGPLNP